MNPSYWSYLRQLSYRTGAPHCMACSISISQGLVERVCNWWWETHVVFWPILDFWAINLTSSITCTPNFTSKLRGWPKGSLWSMANLWYPRFSQSHSAPSRDVPPSQLPSSQENVLRENREMWWFTWVCTVDVILHKYFPKKNCSLEHPFDLQRGHLCLINHHF